MKTLKAKIKKDHQAAARCLRATPSEIKRGLALHKELFACDLFGFMPVTWSLKASETLRRMIENGASHAEIQPVRESISRITSVFNPECRKEFGAMVAASGFS